MERLTWRDEVGQALLVPKYNDKYDALELIDILLDRLAAYEDTELKPEAIRTLAADFSMCAAVLASHQKNKEGKTNADKIRQMSDEELAAWLTFLENKILEKQPKLGRAELEADWLYWLKHEAKKNDG